MLKKTKQSRQIGVSRTMLLPGDTEISGNEKAFCWIEMSTLEVELKDRDRNADELSGKSFWSETLQGISWKLQ